MGKAASRRVTSHEPPASARESKARAAARQASQEPRAPSRDPQVANFDRIIHERLRLGIISALAVNDRLTFNDLKRLLDTTDGNLSVHARKLEEAGYLQCTKTFEGRTPRTEFRLTAAGRIALNRYLDHMEAVIQAARKLGK